MKKTVLKVDLHGDKEKQKAMKAVAGLLGIDSITMDMNEKKLTVIGEVDPVVVVKKLRKVRKQWRHTCIVTVGPAKEEKKDEGKDGSKKEDEKKLDELFKACYPYYPPYYYVVRVDESPTSCTMC